MTVDRRRGDADPVNQPRRSGKTSSHTGLGG
jgi:hypothetical protein